MLAGVRDISKSNIVRRVLSNTSWLTVEKIIIMGISLAVSVFLARSLGPAAWGELNYLLALVTLLGPFTSLGLNAIVTRELVNKPQQADKIMATVIALRFIGGVVGVVLCILAVIIFIGGGSNDLLLILMLLLSSLFNSGKVAEFWFQARMENKYVSIFRVSVRLAFALAKVLAVLLTSEFWVLVAVFAAEIAFLGLGYFALYLSRGGVLNIKSLDFSYGLGLVRQSYWLILSTMASVIYLKVDQIMLEKMKGDVSVGIYAVAVRLSEVWFFFPVAFAAAIFPVLLKVRSSDGARYRQQLQISCDLLFYSALALTVLVVVAAPWFVTTVFGVEYKNSASVLSIHILGASLVFMRALVSKWLIAESLLRFSLWSDGLGAISNVLLNLILIPQYGYWGAAWATVISYVISCYLCFWVFAETRPIALVMTRSMLLPINWHKAFRRSSRYI